MAKRGRKQIEIKWDEFDSLCALMCTLAEIADFFKCSEDTIERAVKREKKMLFADYFKKASSVGKRSIRRTQYEVAKKGNVPMLIWLGKQWLGQKDKTEISGDDDKPIGLAYDPTKPYVTGK